MANQLPILNSGGVLYYFDKHSKELRSICNPTDTIKLEDIFVDLIDDFLRVKELKGKGEDGYN